MSVSGRRRGAIGVALVVAAGVWASAMIGCAGGGDAGASTPAEGEPEAGGRWVNGQWVAARFDRAVDRSALRERAAELLLESFREGSAETRAHALEALAATPGRLESPAATALGDENPGVRSVAATLVGQAGLEGLQSRVWPLVRDPSPYVQMSAIYALWSTGASPDPTPIADALMGHPSARVRAHAAFVLGEMGNPSALAMLRQAAVGGRLPGSEAERRVLELQIAEAMVKLGEEEQIQTLRSALYPSRPEELEATMLALQAIGNVGDRRQVDELLAVARYRDESGRGMPPEIQLTAARSMVKLGETGATRYADDLRFDESARVRALAAFVYGESDRIEALPKLDAMLDDPSERVRIAAAAGILRVADRVRRG